MLFYLPMYMIIEAYTIILISKLMKIRYIDPTRLFWVYMIILNSNKGNLHDYSEW